jgi:hypothetical protein
MLAAEVRLKMAEDEHTRLLADHNRLLAQVQANQAIKK